MDNGDVQPAALMNRSAEIAQLAAALATAQGMIVGAARDSVNPHFRSKYADLASVWDACREPLSKNGLAVIQPVQAKGAQVTVTTILAHKSGEWISSDLTLNAAQNTPQAIGSAITYGRRYALASMVGVAPDDDDGEAAEGRNTPPARPNASRPEPPPPAPFEASDDDLPKNMGGNFEPGQNPAEERKSQARSKRPWSTFKGMLDEFGKLKAALGPTIYYAELKAFGVEHANQFKSGTDAFACYQKLQARVAELEAA